MKSKNDSKKARKGGRPVKTDPANNRYTVNFTQEQHNRFLDLFERSGILSKSAFIKARVFDEVFRVVTTDKSAMEYVSKLTSVHSQFRYVGGNYNQVVKELHTHFSEKKALALLYKLEKITAELAGIGEQIVELSLYFQRNYLDKKQIH